MKTTAQPNIRQDLLYIQTSSTALTSKIHGMSLLEDGEIIEPELPFLYHTPLDAIRDGWRVIQFPAILPSGKSLWPGFWKLEELESLKEELPVSKWSAQYQQDPSAEEGALVKREWWKRWEQDSPPKCEFLIQSWDTASCS